MRSSEWLALAFFVHLATAALVRPLPISRRMTAALGALCMIAAIVAVSRSGGWSGRDWAPAVYVLAGYFLSGRLFVSPQPRVEAWLVAWDRRLLGDPAAWFGGWPGALISVLEAAYIACFVLVPAGYAMLVAAGRADLAEPYWTIVSGAELGSFATLPYLQTRPPWVIERLDEMAGEGHPRASVVFMKHATTGANTLPSGHAAGSLAVALAVIGTLPLEGTILLVLAAVIALAAIVTRAHYAIDVIAGAALATAIWLVAG